jgi:small GTP-binding protein
MASASADVKELIKKICLLGDGAVGKTSLVRRYVYDYFDDLYIRTIGTKVTKKTVTVGARCRLTLLIYDILGQRDYERLHRLYFRGASGALIVGDVTRQETLVSLTTWANAIREVAGEIPLVFIGNKVDLKRGASIAELRKHTKPFEEAPCFLTSAKSGENVETAFYKLGELLCKSTGEKI